MSWLFLLVTRQSPLNDDNKVPKSQLFTISIVCTKSSANNNTGPWRMFSRPNIVLGNSHCSRDSQLPGATLEWVFPLQSWPSAVEEHHRGKIPALKCCSYSSKQTIAEPLCPSRQSRRAIYSQWIAVLWLCNCLRHYAHPFVSRQYCLFVWLRGLRELKRRSFSAFGLFILICPLSFCGPCILFIPAPGY